MKEPWEDLECHIKALLIQGNDLSNRMKMLRMQMRSYFSNCKAAATMWDDMKSKIDNVPPQLPDEPSTSQASREDSQ